MNLAVPGTYTYRYLCTNSAGRSADPGKRIVVVQDKVCPVCTLVGQASITREASFPYVDGGAICNDNIDGALTAVQSSTVDVSHSGIYTVEYHAVDKSSNNNYAACCSSSPPTCNAINSCCQRTVRTVTVKDTLAPVIALRYKNQLISAPTRQDNNPATWFGRDHLNRAAARVGTPNNNGNPFLWGNMWSGEKGSLMEETPATMVWFSLSTVSVFAVGAALVGYAVRSQHRRYL